MFFEVNGVPHQVIFSRGAFMHKTGFTYYLHIRTGSIFLVNIRLIDSETLHIFWINHLGYCIDFRGKHDIRRINLDLAGNRIDERTQIATVNALLILRFYLLHGKLPIGESLQEYDPSAEKRDLERMKKRFERCVDDIIKARFFVYDLEKKEEGDREEARLQLERIERMSKTSGRNAVEKKEVGQGMFDYMLID